MAHRDRGAETSRLLAAALIVALLSGAMADRHIAAAQSDCATSFIVAKKFKLGSLTGISGLTTIGADVWAVGTYHVGRKQHTFLVQWDGDSWNWLPVPTPRRGSYYLTGIDATAPDDIWLAGTHEDFPNQRAVILRWTAGEWTRMPVPEPEYDGTLLDIVVISPTDAWAVGSWDTPEPAPSVNPLAYHWDGTEWTRHDPPRGKRWYVELINVDASAPDDVWALATGGTSPIIWRWDGTAWTRHPFPRYEDPAPHVSGLDVVAPDEVWFAGSLEDRQYTAQVWRWDGTAFAETSTYDPKGYEFLADVAMTGDTGYAVGNETRGRYNEAMVLQWNGQDWVGVSAARPASESYLGEVAVADDGTVWASGGFDWPRGRSMAMIQRSCGPTE